MLTVVTKLFSRRPKESHRERALSNQVDQLEFELAKARHERDAARLRLADERAAFDQHRLRDYPASPASVHNRDLFHTEFTNPVDQLLADVAALGYDVSGPAQVHHATLALIAQYQQDVARVMDAARSMRHNQVPLRPHAHPIELRAGMIQKNCAATH